MTAAQELNHNTPTVNAVFQDLLAAVGEIPINVIPCAINIKNLTAAKLLLLGVMAAIADRDKLEFEEPIARDLEQAVGFMAAAQEHLEEDRLTESMMNARSRDRFRTLSAAVDSLTMAQLRADGARQAIAGTDDDCPF